VAKQFACRISLIAFATATIRGAISGADFEGTISAALLALALFFGIGLVCGELARRLVEEHVRNEVDRMRTETVHPQT
jgi:uncharacterized membrane protein